VISRSSTERQFNRKKKKQSGATVVLDVRRGDVGGGGDACLNTTVPFSRPYEAVENPAFLRIRRYNPQTGFATSFLFEVINELAT
jgi:hypothetical protein